MTSTPPAPIRALPDLEGRVHAFADRAHAGEVVADMLADHAGSDAVVVAIPAGGVPVAAAIARALGLRLEVAPVSKVLLPWTTEAGCGAVAFDGSSWIDEDAAARFGLTDEALRESTRAARAKVERRVQRFCGGRPPDVEGRTVIIVDDGVAAGSTMRAAIAALRRLRPARVVVAVPTAHRRALEALAGDADDVRCANMRGGARFAVADAYRTWNDVTDDDAEAALRSLRERG